MSTASKITVRFGQMASPLKVSQIKSGTTLEAYLKLQEMEYNSSIRVNGKVASKSYALKNGDIILSVEAVSGGSIR